MDYSPKAPLVNSLAIGLCTLSPSGNILLNVYFTPHGYLLPTTYYLLLTTYYLLPTTYNLLPTIYPTYLYIDFIYITFQEIYLSYQKNVCSFASEKQNNYQQQLKI